MCGFESCLDARVGEREGRTTGKKWGEGEFPTGVSTRFWGKQVKGFTSYRETRTAGHLKKTNLENLFAKR